MSASTPPAVERSRTTGHAPVLEAYRHANRILARGREIICLRMTRFEYGLLAEMARSAGDLPFERVGSRVRRLARLAGGGYVRRVRALRRYELTADGWKLLTEAEAAYHLAQDPALAGEFQSA